MANLSFIDALSEQKRRSVLTGRPEEKATMDKTLRENAIRRLTTNKQNVAPPVPAVNEVVRGGGDEGALTPQGLESSPTIGTTPSVIGPDVPTKGSLEALGLPTAPPEGILDYAKAVYDFSSNVNPAVKAPMLMYDLVKMAMQSGRGNDFDMSTPPDVVLSSSFDNQGMINGEPYGGQIAGPPQGIVSKGETTNPNPNSPINSGFLATDAEAAQAESGGAAAFGDTVLCGELYRQGKLDWNIYLLDSKYGQTLPAEVMIGYSLWAIPLSHRMARSPLLSSIVRPFVTAWAYEMAHRMDNRVKGSVLGKIMSFVGEPLCGFIGRSMNHGLLRT